jgi:hypothetical protein
VEGEEGGGGGGSTREEEGEEEHATFGLPFIHPHGVGELHEEA